MLFIFNKTETMNNDEILEKVKQLDLEQNKNWMAISATSGKNLDILKQKIKEDINSKKNIQDINSEVF